MATIDWDNLSSGDEEEEVVEKNEWGGGKGGGIDWDNMSSGEEPEEEKDEEAGDEEMTEQEQAMRARLLAALEEETREYEAELQEKEEKKAATFGATAGTGKKPSSKIKLGSSKSKKEKEGTPVFERKSSLSHLSQGLLRRSDGGKEEKEKEKEKEKDKKSKPGKKQSEKRLFFTGKSGSSDSKDSHKDIHRDSQKSERDGDYDSQFQPPAIPSYMVHLILAQQAESPIQDTPPLYQGQVLKTTPHKMQKKDKKNLKQRWLVLYPSVLLFFEKFYDETPIVSIKTSDVNNVVDIRSKFTTTNSSGFEVEYKGGTYIFFCENEKIKQDWMSAFKKATSGGCDAWSSVRTVVFLVEMGPNKKIVRCNVDMSYEDIRQAIADKVGASAIDNKMIWDVAQHEFLNKSMQKNPIAQRGNDKIVVTLK